MGFQSFSVAFYPRTKQWQLFTGMGTCKTIILEHNIECGVSVLEMAVLMSYACGYVLEKRNYLRVQRNSVIMAEKV